MSDEPERNFPASSDGGALPIGVVRLAQAALNAPPPNPEAEAAAQERALAAYQEALITPRPLHEEPWRSGSPSLPARIGRFFRRLGGG